MTYSDVTASLGAVADHRMRRHGDRDVIYTCVGR